MRVVIDIQACQSVHAGGPYGRRVMRLLQGLLRVLDRHEVVLLANGAQAGALPLLRRALASGPANGVSFAVFDSLQNVAACRPDRAWQRRAAQLLREDFIQALCADAVLVLNPWQGWDDDLVFSLGTLQDAPTLVLLPPEAGLPPPPCSRGLLETAHGFWREDVLREVAKARHLLAWQDPAPCAGPHAALPALPATLLGAEPDTAAQAIHDLLQRLAEERSAPPPSVSPVLHKPRLAYVSPLPPAASGIADYSADLIPALAEHYDIELVVDPANEVSAHWHEQYPVRSVAWFREHAQRYDRILYHFGNSAFHAHMVELLRHIPGTVVLHDFYLGHLFGNVQHSGKIPLALRRALFRSHGMRALDDWREHGEAAALAKYPCSFEIFAQADGVVVHSAHAEDLAARWYGPELPCVVQRVPLAHASPPQGNLPALREQARAALGLSAEDVLVCSFGYVGAGKRSLDLVRAWQLAGLAGNAAYRLVLVGGHQMEGEAREALEAELRKPESLGVTLTGYVPPEVYHRYLAAADLAVQLRTDSRGETSRAVLDAFAHGVPLLVNAHGAAAELPPSAAVILADTCSIDELAAAMVSCLADRGERERLSREGAHYVRQVHAPDQVAPLYRAAIERAAALGPRSVAGRGRALMRTLARETPVHGRYPSAAEVERLACRIAASSGLSPGRRVVPDTTAIARPGRGREARALHLVLLTESPALSGAYKSELQQRREAMRLSYEDAGMVVECCHWVDLPGLMARTGGESGTPPDVIQIDTLETWLQLRPLWIATAPGAGRPSAAPLLVCDAGAHGLWSSSGGTVAGAANAEPVRELAALADVLLTGSEAAAGIWAGRRGHAAGVMVVKPGGLLPTESTEASEAVYRDHLPQRPYALVLSGEPLHRLDDFLYFLGESLAYLPPDAMLLIVGELGQELEHDPRFQRWRGVNHSRCRIIASPDALGMAAIRRHADLIVLPWRSRSGDTASATMANALLDGHPVLATSAALQGYEAEAGCRQVMVENTPQGFRARLVRWRWTARAAAAVACRDAWPAPLPATAGWEVNLSVSTLEVGRLAMARRRRSGGLTP